MKRQIEIMAIVTAVWLGGASMSVAQDAPEVAAAKAEKLKVEAQKDLVTAQKDLLTVQQQKQQAERNLAQDKSDAETAAVQAAATAATNLANAQKAKSQAEVEAINAEVAAAKAKLGVGLVPGSGITGDVSVGTSAGNFESSLLAARALNEAARSIADATGTTPGDAKRYVIFTGTTRPSFADVRLFEAKAAIVAAAYKSADQARAAANLAFSKLPSAVAPRPGAGPVTESVVAAAATAGAALDTLSKLGSYFQSNYSVSNATVTGPDSDLLAVALAGNLTDAWYPARWSPPGSANGVQGLMGELPALRQASVEKAAQMLDQQKALTAAAAAEKNAARKKAIEGVAAQYGTVGATLAGTDKAYDDLLNGLAESDTAGVARITRVMDQKAITDELNHGAQALLVNVAGAGGTNYTKKNLWTFFGGMPFYVSGGAIVSYAVIDKDGAIKKAGQWPLHSGFKKLQAASILTGGSR